MSKNREILLVEDDPDARGMIEIMLEQHGFTCTSCASGEEALSKMEESVPGLVLLDIMMPGLNGYDVLVRMKQRPETQNIPVIMVTAKGEGDEIITGYQHGADYYIPKPFTSQQLLYGIGLFFE